MKKIAINGFGRIGRSAARIILARPELELELVAINDPSPAEQTAHLFQFDSNFGPLSERVSLEKDGQILKVGAHKILNFSTRNIAELNWRKLGIDAVLECTGVFRTAEAAAQHLESGAKKVLLSAPAKSDGFATVVLGVNEEILNGDETLISAASCTTNCLAPVAKVLDETLGIESGLMTTVHSYTNDQRILDVGHSDLRRARAAAQNIIPTSTGAAKAVGLVLPHLAGRLNGTSLRVPTPTVSLVDLVAKVRTQTSAEEVNKILKSASDKNPEILGFESRPCVSTDFKMDARSSIVDAAETMVSGDLVKVLSWYDNEWGYSNRLVELAAQV